MVTIKIYLVDESYREYEEGPEILQELEELRQMGYEGKDLINTLISDDWAAPPRAVRIVGTNSDGNPIDIAIQYE